MLQIYRVLSGHYRNLRNLDRLALANARAAQQTATYAQQQLEACRRELEEANREIASVTARANQEIALANARADRLSWALWQADTLHLCETARCYECEDTPHAQIA